VQELAPLAPSSGDLVLRRADRLLRLARRLDGHQGRDRLRRNVGCCSGLLDSRNGCYSAVVTFTVEIDREDDGRWIAEVPTLPGVLCYGKDRDEAVAGVQALALRVIAERLEQREAPAEFLNVTFQAA
jgi:predicted RNase H-like HicB family nuclease